MRSVTTARFRKSLERLPKKIQTRAVKVYALWSKDPQHPSISFKQIHSTEPIYSVRIGLGYRALGILNDKTMVWFWIGSHEDYNSLIKTM